MGDGSGGAVRAASSAGDRIRTLANQVTSEASSTAPTTDNPRTRCLISATVPS